MPIVYTLLIIIGLYFFIVFVVLRFLVPYMGFRRMRMPQPIPEEIQTKISELEAASSTADEYLKQTYDFVIARWHAGRFAYIHAPLAFRKDLVKIWNQPGFAWCNTQNYLIFVLLAGSKFFKPEDIQFKCVFYNFFLHQYLQVKTPTGSVDLDPGGAGIRNMPMGSRIKLFG